MKTVIPLLLLTGLISCADPQPKAGQGIDLDSLDNALAEMYTRMWVERSDMPYESADTFEMKMVEALRNPATFDYPFDSLSGANVWTVMSDDGRIRVFNWLDPYTGSFRHYPAIFQIRDAAGTVTVWNADSHDDVDSWPCVDYASLSPLNDSLYLALGAGQLMGSMVFETAFAYELDAEGLTLADSLFPEAGSDTLVGTLWVDKIWYLKNAAKFDYYLPAVMQFHPASMTLSYPEFVYEKSRKQVVEVGVSQEVIPSGDTVYLRFNGKYFANLTP